MAWSVVVVSWLVAAVVKLLLMWANLVKFVLMVVNVCCKLVLASTRV